MHTHIYTYIHIYIYTGSSDTACTWVDLHTAPKDIRNERCVKLCQHGICRLNANSDLHRKMEFALQHICKYHLHLHHIPLLKISSGSGWFLQNLFGAMCQSLVVSDPFIGVPSGASFQTVEVLGC